MNKAKVYKMVKLLKAYSLGTLDFQFEIVTQDGLRKRKS